MLSVEEYLRTSYKPNCDYIDGVLRQKPYATYNHSSTQLKLCVLINQLNNGFEAVPELTVLLSATKCFVPDVAVQADSDLQEPYPIRPIHLCAEVLSPEDYFDDIVAKCSEYHLWGVLNCWIVDPDSKRCWQYDAGGRPIEIPSDGRITAGPIILNHADIFDSV